MKSTEQDIPEYGEKRRVDEQELAYHELLEAGEIDEAIEANADIRRRPDGGRKPVIVRGIAHLKELALDGGEFFILLKGGVISRKLIWHDEDAGQFEILNCIDDSEQFLSEEQVMDSRYTNIGAAIKKRSLFFEGKRGW